MPDTPPDPPGPRPPFSESRREPATIDLTATEVRTDAAHAADDRPSEAQAEPERDPRADQTADEAASESAAYPTPTPDEVIPSDEPAASANAEGNVPLGTPGEPAEPARRGPGLATLLGAGLIGGLVGAGAMIATGPWWRPAVPRSQDQPAPVVQQPAARVENAIAPLEARLAALEGETKAAADRLRAAQALAERSAQTAEAALNRPQPSAAPAPDGASATAVQDLTARLSALEAQGPERVQANTAIDARVQGIEERVQRIEEQVKAVADTAQSAAAAAQAGAGAIQAAGNAVQGLERRIADQDQRLGAVTRQLSERGPDPMSASLRLVIAERVADAIEDGAPLGQLLTLLRRLEVKPDDLRPLESYAQTGAPSAAALAKEFGPLGRRMITETRPPPSDWNDRLRRVLENVVTVRSLDEPHGSDVASAVARIDRALADGNVAEAAVAWEALPEAARRMDPDWGERLKQRAAAQAAAQKISTDALSALQASAR